MTFQQQPPTTPTIVPLNTPAPAGPWTLTVTQVTTGDEAIAMIQQANAENPAAPEGVVYLLAHVTAQNTSDRPRVINMADFAATGTDGVLRRPPTIEVPQPALQAIVNAGDTLEGNVPLVVDDPATATLWFDSTMLGGAWARVVFALSDAAAIPTYPVADASPSDAGSSPDQPVQLNEPLRTGGWEITITDTMEGRDIYNAADYRLRALDDAFGGTDAVNWFAIFARVTNLSPYPSVFPNDAFLIADSTGEPWDSVLALTPPEPDVSRELLPGATREGWAAFQRQDYEGAGPYTVVSLIHVQPNRTSDTPRYVFIANGPAAGEEVSAAEGSSAAADPLEVQTGDRVVTTEDLVNLRSDTSGSAESIIRELPKGTELEITGDPVEEIGYRWYPVTVVETGETGFIVQDFIAPA